MAGTTTTQALATREQGPGALVEQYRSAFTTVLPAHLNPDAWVRVALGVLRRDKTLTDAAKKNPNSLLAALLDCARLGLEPGDTYHLVAFGSEITGIRDYTGEIELAQRAGCGKVTASIVYEHDEFSFDEGRDDRPTHTPPGGKWFGTNRGEMVGAYGYGVLPDGSTSHVVIMDRAEIMRHKAVSKQPKNWEKWPEPYWRKTIIHELRKWIATSPEFRNEQARATACAEQVAAEVGVPLASSDEFTPHVDDEVAEPEPFCEVCATPLDGEFCPKCDDR